MARMRIGDSELVDADIFGTIFEYFPDILQSVDDDGRISFTNAQAEALLGYSREELLGMHVLDLYAPEVHEDMARGFAVLKEQGSLGVRSLIVDREGNRIPVEVRSFSIYGDDGAFLRSFSILRDVRRLEELQAGLVHAGRLAAIGELASGVAHDINNPLLAVRLGADMAREVIREAGDDPELALAEVDAALQDMEKAGRSIGKLVDHLRNFSRGVVEQPERVDLKAVVQDALFLASSRVLKGRVDVDAEVADGCWTVGRPNQLEQVFVNLVTNAVDATDGRPSARLRIRVRPVSRGERADWRCEVTDNGAGVPPELREHIFESFFTTKDKGKGTGLGLSICRGIVDDHGGHIELISEEGAGTTFAVHLPRADPPPA